MCVHAVPDTGAGAAGLGDTGWGQALAEGPWALSGAGYPGEQGYELTCGLSFSLRCPSLSVISFASLLC